MAAGLPKRCAVLDIETAPDDHAYVLSRRRRAAPRGSPIHEVVAVSILGFLQATDGSLRSFALRSWHRSEYGERDILANVDMALAGVVEDGGMLVTFNGTGHDLPTLHRRRLRWWMCEGDAVGCIRAGKAEHIDVMRVFAGTDEEARWPTLADACASVGFSLLGPNPVGSKGLVPREVVKCELDVVGTAILMLYVLASRRRSREVLVRGLPAFGRFVREAAMTRPHLERFALSKLLAEDACAWGDAEV